MSYRRTVQFLHIWSIMPSISKVHADSTGPDGTNDRASASGAGGRGSNPGCAIPKALKMVPVASLLGAQHYEASTGSPLTHY